MKFSQVLKEYSEFKKSRGLKESRITSEELKRLRRRFERGDFDEKSSTYQSFKENKENEERQERIRRIKERLAKKKRMASIRERIAEKKAEKTEATNGQSLKEKRLERIERIKKLRERRKALLEKKNSEKLSTRKTGRFSESKKETSLAERKQTLKERLEQKARVRRIKARIQERRMKECNCKDGECDCDKKNLRKPSSRPTSRIQRNRFATEEREESLKERLEKIRRNRKIREARIERIKRRHIKEGEMGGTVDAVSGEGMETTDTTAPATLNANADASQISATIEQIKTEIDNLATQLGVATDNGMDTNPDANIPPEGDINMDTMEGAENTTAPAPMPESKKKSIEKSLTFIRESLKNKAIREAFETRYPLSSDAIIKLIDTTPFNVDKTNDESMLNKVLSLNQMIKGTEKNCIRWGQEKKDKINYKYEESATEKMVSDKIKENQERWDFAKIIKSGVLN